MVPASTLAQYTWTGYNQTTPMHPQQMPVYAVNVVDNPVARGGYWDEAGLTENGWDTENSEGLQTFADQL